MQGRLKTVVVSTLLLAAGASTWAQTIYTCTDSKGRRITADRPIVDCIDRAQKELNPSGTVRRTLTPSMTAAEAEAAAAKVRADQEARQREEEERRRIRALAARFPDRAAHDKERAAALRQIEEAISVADRRSAELQAQHKRLAAEAGFYKSDPTKMPPALKRLVDDNQQQMAVQERLRAEHLDQKKRINARFDAELAQLQKLWGPQAEAAAAAARKP